MCLGSDREAQSVTTEEQHREEAIHTTEPLDRRLFDCNLASDVSAVHGIGW